MKQNEITIETKALREACDLLGKLKPRSRILPVLAYALLTPPAGKDDPGTLACNTLDEAMRVTLPMKAGKLAQPCLVPFALLKRAAEGATEIGALHVLTSPGNVPPVVTWDAGFASMEESYDPIDVADFPPMPAEPAWLPAGTLLANYAACIPFASTDECRIVLTGACFFPPWQATKTDTIPPSFMPGAHVVATDGRRIECRPVEGCGLDKPVIIPTCDALLALAKKDEQGKVGMVAGDKGYAGTLAVQVGQVTHWIRSIDGTYPNWRQVIPPITDNGTCWTVTPEETSALGKILRALPKTGQDMTITLAPGKDGKPATATCKSGNAKATLTLASYTGEGMACFNLAFMLEAITDGPVRVRITYDLSPARIESDSGRVHAIMPMRLS